MRSRLRFRFEGKARDCDEIVTPVQNDGCAVRFRRPDSSMAIVPCGGSSRSRGWRSRSGRRAWGSLACWESCWPSSPGTRTSCPLTSLLALVIIAGLALIGGALWRIVRGPGRLEALSWLLLGSAPLWFLAGYFLYGLAVGYGRTIPMNLPIKLLAPLGESLMDLEARFRYPQRTVGREGRDDLGADARGRGPRPGGRDGPARPRPRGAAGPGDHGDDPLGSGAAAGDRGQGHLRPVHGEPAGRGRRRMPRAWLQSIAMKSPIAC